MFSTLSRHRSKQQDCAGIGRASSQPVAVIAQQLSDLLLAFPAAVSSGVRWRVLSRKYQERYKVELNIGALGHSTPLAAGTTLLWDVLQVVDKSDPMDPVFGIESAVALTPRAGLLGCWPSLYRALCEIVREEGSSVDDSNGDQLCLLLSQVRPRLEHYWLANFDESGLGFLNADGGFIRLKKLKHLLQWLLKWRAERLAWRESHESRNATELDKILEPTLRLVPSEKYNDLLLIYSPDELSNLAPPSIEIIPPAPGSSREEGDCEKQSPENSVDGMRRELDRLRSERYELERLRSENRDLRVENRALHLGATQQTKANPTMFHPCQQPILDIPAQIFDDPFEPPPEARTWGSHCSWSSVSRTTSISDIGGVDMASEFSMGSSSMAGTPRFFGMSAHSTCGSEVPSGGITPHGNCQAQQQTGGAFVPVWFFGGVDFSVIPHGIVETARAHFERLGGK